MMGRKLATIISIVTLGVVVCFATVKASATQTQTSRSVDNSKNSKEIYFDKDTKYNVDDVSNGAILQAWCWSFDTIKENLPYIKKAGFSAVQTSPIQECRVGENNNDNSLELKNWYYTYQPVDFVVGNYQVGTKKDLEELCEEAEKYGIKIIADVVINHMSSEWNYIKPNMQKREYFNTNYGITNWEDRYCLVNMALSGLWDLKTTSKDVQNIIKTFLKDCVSLGVDGFRYDCAKHIELPEDEGFGSDFWPYITNNGAEIQIGEVLKGSTARYDKYAQYVNVTAAEYGEVMQKCLRERDFSVDRLLDYRVDGVSPSRVVTWVESHDNFANDEMDSVWMTDEDIKLGWAAITARADTTTVMFNRPLGAGGTDYDSRFPGHTKIGDRGSELFMDDEVAAVNIFCNEMEGEDEYLRNIYNGRILMIERGNRGAVIINLNDADMPIESYTRLTNGKYVNRTDNNNIFNVSNNRLEGIVPARSVAVIYKSKLEMAGEYIDVKTYVEDVENYFVENYHTITLIKSDNVHATYEIDGRNVGGYFNGQKVRIGEDTPYGKTTTVRLRAKDENGNIETKTYYFTKRFYDSVYRIKFEKDDRWNEEIYCYAYGERGELAPWPGLKMRDCGDNTYELIVPIDINNTMKYVIFNDTKEQVPTNGNKGFWLFNHKIYNSKGQIKDID